MKKTGVKVFVIKGIQSVDPDIDMNQGLGKTLQAILGPITEMDYNNDVSEQIQKNISDWLSKDFKNMEVEIVQCKQSVIGTNQRFTYFLTVFYQYQG